MKKFERIKELHKAYTEIEDLFLQKIPNWNKKPEYYDKVRVGFNEGDNDGWYTEQAIKLHFGAWCGTYGDSSTYKEFSIDGVIFKEAFLRYLNRNKQDIMLGIAELIKKDALALKTEAEKEVQAQKDLIDSIELSTPPSSPL